MLKKLKMKCIRSSIVRIIICSIIAIGVDYYTEFSDMMRVMWVSGQWDILQSRRSGTFLVGAIVVSVCILMILAAIINIVAGRNLIQFKKYLQENPTYTMEDIEADLTSAVKVGKKAYMGTNWIIHVTGERIALIPVSEIIWAYYYEIRQNGVPSFYLIIHKKNKVGCSILMRNKEEVMNVLNEIKQRELPIVIGYSKELMKIFKKEFDRFVTLANQANRQDEM
jgi:hypothetical protein